MISDSSVLNIGKLKSKAYPVSILTEEFGDKAQYIIDTVSKKLNASPTDLRVIISRVRSGVERRIIDEIRKKNEPSTQGDLGSISGKKRGGWKWAFYNLSTPGNKKLRIAMLAKQGSAIMVLLYNESYLNRLIQEMKKETDEKNSPVKEELDEAKETLKESISKSLVISIVESYTK